MKVLYAILIMTIFSGCISTVSVKEARELQQTKGFYSQSLYYHGSTDGYHFFSQIQPDHSFWVLFKGKGIFASKEIYFKIPFYELYVNDLLFPYEAEEKLKTQISALQPFILKRKATLKDKLERMIIETKEFKNKFDGFDERIRDAIIIKIEEKK